MLIIEKNSTWLGKGAIVPTKKELEVIIHALIEEYDQVVRSGGNRYGLMDHLEMKALIEELQKYKTERGL